MKLSLSILLSFSFLACFAQSDSLVRSDLRNLQKNEIAELNEFALQIYSMSDSLLTSGNKVWFAKFDSLASDSALLASGAGFLCDLEKCFIGLEQKGSADVNLMSRVLQGVTTLDTQTKYYKTLHTWMLGHFKLTRNWENALICADRLHQALSDELIVQNEIVRSSNDSLSEALAMQKSLLRTTEANAGHRESIGLMVIGGLLVALLALLIVFMVVRSGLRKKLIEASRKASDKSELEAITQKLNEHKSENLQLKGVSKISQEKVALMEESRRKLIQNLKVLAEEINGGLEEVKAQSESNKPGMNPSAYMAIQNAVTRMGNTIAQRFQLISESLK